MINDRCVCDPEHIVYIPRGDRTHSHHSYCFLGLRSHFCVSVVSVNVTVIVSVKVGVSVIAVASV